MRAFSGSTDNMAHIPGGSFLMGTDDEVGYPDDGEGPIREVAVAPDSSTGNLGFRCVRDVD